MEDRPDDSGGGHLRLTFKGGRFDIGGGGVPTEILARLAGVERSLKATARGAFMNANEGRLRVPPRFKDGLALILREFKIGQSATLDFFRAESEDEPNDMDKWQEDSVGLLLNGLRALTEEDDNTLLPTEAFVGMSFLTEKLASDERLIADFVSEDGSSILSVLTITSDDAVKISNAAKRETEVAREVVAAGIVRKVDADKRTLTVRLREDGARRTYLFAHDKVDMCAGLLLKPVWLSAVVEVDGEDRSCSYGTIKDIRELEGPAINERFEYIATLEDGWLNGIGKAPTKRFVEQVRKAAWRLVESLGVPRPRAFPTEEGGIQLEWDEADICFQPFDLTYRVYTATVVLKEEDELEGVIDLDSVIQWYQALLERVRGGE